jgi:hypothetical protein
MSTTATTIERQDFLETLEKHRGFLRFTARGLSDDQAAAKPTASELCIGGVIKHVAAVESGWVDFMLTGGHGSSAASTGTDGDDAIERYLAGFRMVPGDTLEGLLERYAAVARRTDEVVATLPDLDDAHPLPKAPWFEPGARWSGRRVLLHIIAETAQHAGHADIIRQSLDGQKTMG